MDFFMDADFWFLSLFALMHRVCLSGGPKVTTDDLKSQGVPGKKSLSRTITVLEVLQHTKLSQQRNRSVLHRDPFNTFPSSMQSHEPQQ